MKMKKFKRIQTIGAIILAVGATSVTAFAASAYTTPAEAVAGLTNQTLESVMTQKQETGKTYGQIAADAGQLDAFKKEAIEMKKENLKSQVEAGRITQEKADEIIKMIEENQADCDGTGSGRIGQPKGGRFGSEGKGKGEGRGNGKGQGQGRMRIQD